jgi:HSP20 family protein
MNAGKHAIKVEQEMKEKEIIVRAEIPGIDPDKDVHIHVSDGMLTISGEREESKKSGTRSEFYYGSFTRTLPLPNGTSDKGVRATYKDGILEVHVPINGEVEHPKRIPIQKL